MLRTKEEGGLGHRPQRPASLEITKLNLIIFGRYLWQRQNGKDNCLTFFNMLTIRHIR
jgi:hypothetical protein